MGREVVFLPGDSVRLIRAVETRSKGDIAIVRETFSDGKYLIEFESEDRYGGTTLNVLGRRVELVGINHNLTASKINSKNLNKISVVQDLIQKLNASCKRGGSPDVEWSYLGDMKTVFKIVSSYIPYDAEKETMFDIGIIYTIPHMNNKNIRIVAVPMGNGVKYEVLLLQSFFDDVANSSLDFKY